MKKSLLDLESRIQALLDKYNPYEIQCMLADQYLKSLQLVEPDYEYVPKERRKQGETFVEPMTSEGRYWLKNYLGSRNLCSGMKKWLDELVDELEEEK